MRLQFDVKSIVLGAVIGWFVTVSRASIAVAKNYIDKEQK